MLTNKQDLFSGLVVAVHALSYPQPRHPLQSHLATDTPRYEEQSPGKGFTNKNHHGCPQHECQEHSSQQLTVVPESRGNLLLLGALHFVS